MRPLAGKIALVTGAARGIGQAIALRLAERGMRLALADRDVVGLAETLRRVERVGGDAIACPCDLSDPAAIDRLADHMLQRTAGVDLLVNNAGIAHYGPTRDMPAERLDALLAVNLAAPIRLTKALLPSLLARPEAHVLNVASVLGLATAPRVAAYCASKHGLIGFSEALRAECGRSGLGVTTLCPGFVRTPLLEEASPDQPKLPPAAVCVSIDRVAKAAVHGVERNRRRVVVDPVGRLIRGVMRTAPGLFDWMNSLGRGKRITAKQRELDRTHPDREEALRVRLGIEPAPAHRTPMAA